MPANDIGIDMGTSSCLVYSTGKGLILKEPTVVVYDKDTEQLARKQNRWRDMPLLI